MRAKVRLASALAALGLAAGCASGGGPTITAGSTASTSGAPASVPVGPPMRADRGKARAIKRVTLVEATGRGRELDAFVSRLLSESEDKELFVIADARLSGASLGVLAADPNGPAATKFREAWPGEAYLQVTLADCYIKTQRYMTPDTTPDGYRTTRVTYSYDATCPATMKIADAEDGHVLATVEVSGRAKFTGDAESGETPAEEEAARDAAVRAVKKLRSELGR